MVVFIRLAHQEGKCIGPEQIGVSAILHKGEGHLSGTVLVGPIGYALKHGTRRKSFQNLEMAAYR